MSFKLITIGSLKNKLNNKFIRNLGWLGGSELALRGFRLITTVVLARFLTSYDYGLAAIVLTTHEFTQVLARIGLTHKLIQADKEYLDDLANSAYWLNWLIYVGLFVIQCIASFGIAWFYKDNRLILPICALAIVYLISPWGRIQYSLIQRENRLKVTAVSNTLKMGVGNLLAAIFAVLGFGMWAIVLGKLLPTPIEAIISLKKHPWRPSQKFTTKYWGELLKFGTPILGIQLLSTARDNMDYLIVGRFLGVEELGIYFWAFNAGLGISLSIIQSINVALYPHLCAVRDNWEQFKKRYFSGLKTASTIIVPFVLLQSCLAPFYVPIVFGQKWVVGVPVLILICLSAIPRAFNTASNNLLMAVGRPDLTFNLNVLFTLLFIGGLLIGVQWQAIGVAISVLVTHLIFVPLVVVWSARYVFYKLPASTPNS